MTSFQGGIYFQVHLYKMFSLMRSSGIFKHILWVEGEEIRAYNFFTTSYICILLPTMISYSTSRVHWEKKGKKVWRTKGQTNRRTDRRTKWHCQFLSCSSQLKIKSTIWMVQNLHTIYIKRNKHTFVQKVMMKSISLVEAKNKNA